MTFKFWEMLKNASEATLVPTNIFFLKLGNLSTNKYFFPKTFELRAKFRGVQSKPG